MANTANPDDDEYAGRKPRLSLSALAVEETNGPTSSGPGIWALLSQAEPLPGASGEGAPYTANANSYDPLKELNTRIVSITGSTADKAIGSALAARTDMFQGKIAYCLGSKSLESGAIDCSGWVANNTLAVMKAANEKAGREIYDMKDMQNLLNQSAGDQVAGFGKREGFLLSPQDIRSGNVPPGTIIGIRRQNVPSWAADRPGQISHIGQVVCENGQLFISSSGEGGVHLTPYDKWIGGRGIETLYAVDPFALTTRDGKALLEAKVKADEGTKVAQAVAPAAANHTLTGSSQSHHGPGIGHGLAHNKMTG
jgi:hypothetical protein